MSAYSKNDWRYYEQRNDVLAHSWGTSPEQKKRESQYNHDYWERNRERIMAARQRARDAIGVTARDERNAARQEANAAQQRRDAAAEREGTAWDQYMRSQTAFDDYRINTTNPNVKPFADAAHQSSRDLEAAISANANATRAYREAESTYADTPLGKIENAASAARDAVADALDSVKNLTVSALSNLRRR